MSEPPTTGVVNGVTKTAGKVVDAISSPVLITMLIVFGGLVGAVMYLWDKQSTRNQEGFISLVEECVPNNREKE